MWRNKLDIYLTEYQISALTQRVAGKIRLLPLPDLFLLIRLLINLTRLQRQYIQELEDEFHNHQHGPTTPTVGDWGPT